MNPSTSSPTQRRTVRMAESESVNINNKKKVVTDSIEMDFSSQITDVIDKEEKRVKLERKSEVDERE